MQTLTFSQLPLIARVAVALALFTWVIFEEGVVDRFGLWQYMPGYIKAQICPWDVAAAGIILVPLLLLRRPSWARRAQTQTAD